ncbi:MAG: TolC family protein [Planctomycetota bacterium]
MRRLLGPLAALWLSACASLDPAPDRAAVHDDAAARAGFGAVAVPGTLDAAIADEVAALLRAPLDDAAAVRVALLNNHRVRATMERLGIARADLVQAGLLRNPVFDGDARFLFDGGTELELGLAAPFVDLFWRPLRARLAEHEFAAARALITDELLQLAFAVRRALVDVRGATMLEALYRDALRAAEAAHELAVAQREQVVRTTLQHYNAMQIGVFDVLAQRRLQLADQREHATTLAAAHRARLDLQELLAGAWTASAA